VTLGYPLLSITVGTTLCVSVTPAAVCILIGTYTARAADIKYMGHPLSEKTTTIKQQQ
jgi:hypothetical protein